MVVELAAYLEGTNHAGTVRDMVVSRGKSNVLAVMIDPRSPAATLVDPLEALRVKLTLVDVSTMAAAHGDFADQLKAGKLAIEPHPMLTAAAQHALTRPLSGAEALERRKPVVDTSPIVAAELAVWGVLHVAHPPCHVSTSMKWRKERSRDEREHRGDRAAALRLLQAGAGFVFALMGWTQFFEAKGIEVAEDHLGRPSVARHVLAHLLDEQREREAQLAEAAQLETAPVPAGLPAVDGLTPMESIRANDPATGLSRRSSAAAGRCTKTARGAARRTPASSGSGARSRQAAEGAEGGP